MAKTVEPSLALGQSIVTQVVNLKALEQQLILAGNQELSKIVRLAYLEFMDPAMTGYLNKVPGLDSRAVRGAI